jgi:lipopolysaccharide/colanic/teichoic acid biosynthesis glycosyltransferase
MDEQLISATGSVWSAADRIAARQAAVGRSARRASGSEGWSDLSAAVRAADRRALGEAVGLEEFLRHLQREKRRAERTRSPLSLAIFQLADSVPGNDPQVDRLLDALCAVKRDTDIVGEGGDRLVAVLCTDTDETGTRSLLRKVSQKTGELPFVMSVATWPDDLFNSLAQGVGVSQVFEPFIALEAHAGERDGYPLKRTLDVLGALLALQLFAPIMLAVALAVRLSSPGPVIFRQSRVGKDGVPFTFYKFRSMVAGNSDGIHREFVANLIARAAAAQPAAATTAANDEPALYKIKSDPRVTRVGRFIRRASLDELPQLFNVLKGDMSLVGPRPPLPYETTQYQPWHLRRILSVKPGITGLWQVDGRSRVGFNDMVRMDLRYIRECSLAGDLRILLKTVRVVLHCDGAV